MRDGKPTVPEILMGTLTPNDHNFAHPSNFTDSRHRCCALATLDYLKPFGLVNYIRIVAFSPDSRRVFLYGDTVSIRCSTTMKSLPLTIHIQKSNPSRRVLIQYQEVIISFAPVVACKTIQGRHPGGYFR